MSRTSCDQYKTKEGAIVCVDGMTPPPENAVLWNGYDYDKQCWVHEGQRDTRTLEELRASITLKKGTDKATGVYNTRAVLG